MIQSLLASSLGRKDELPNIELANMILKKNDPESINELIELISSKNKAFQNDSIKVLYEVGEKKPELLISFFDDFIAFLDSKNNRLQWGAMTALHSIAKEYPNLIYPHLETLHHKAMEGSVITRDNFIAIINLLIKEKEYHALAYHYLQIHLQSCPSNQLPMYAEWVQNNIHKDYIENIRQILEARIFELEKESKKKRLLKVINKIQSFK